MDNKLEILKNDNKKDIYKEDELLKLLNKNKDFIEINSINLKIEESNKSNPSDLR